MSDAAAVTVKQWSVYCCATATDELVQEALGHITEGICRPLKVVTHYWPLMVRYVFTDVCDLMQ